MKHKKTSAGFFSRNWAALLLTAGLFAIEFCIVVGFRRDINSTWSSDYFTHLSWAVRLTGQSALASFYDGSEHLWHICVWFLFRYAKLSMWSAAGVVSAAAEAAAFYLIFRTFDTALPEKISRLLTAVLLFCAFIACALVWPGVHFYYGIGSMNAWHNPTNIMVRPFAAAVVYMTVRIYNRRLYGEHTLLNDIRKPVPAFRFKGGFWEQFRVPVFTKAELVLYPLCLLLSAYAKPSFIQYFAPAILLFLGIDVIRTRGRLLPFCLKMALAFVPVGIVCAIQFSGFFGWNIGSAADTTDAAASVAAAAQTAVSSADSEAVSDGVAIYFIKTGFTGVWDVVCTLARQVWYIIRLAAFPVLVFCLAPKQTFRSTVTRFGLLQTFVGWLEEALLHETGARESHGNFSWAFSLSLWLLWTMAVQQYLLLVHKKDRAGKIALYVGTPVLLWHAVGGALYIIQILQTGTYITMP